MKIALDYDRCYTLDKDFWDKVVGLAKIYGHDIRIVTARHEVKDNIDDRVNGLKVIYCDGVAKRFVCHHHHEYDVDVWIDDKPENINSNGPLTRQQLDEWRASEEYKL